jgi:hypothetical protein
VVVGHSFYTEVVTLETEKMNQDSEIHSQFEFWIVGVMMTMVSMVGILGNIICIPMFQYKRLKINKTFASLLKWLAVIDSLFLVSIK